ncbi:MAG: glycosyl transferase [Nitrososphaeraceae archaeon]|nr:glycosyl transferase [Nitrososphaeraceae archaeon]
MLTFDFFIFTFLLFVAIGVLLVWVYLITLLFKSYRNTPQLKNSIKNNISNPKISIILPARNEEKYIKKCIDSLLNQTYSNFELILVNDDSTDGTLNIMESRKYDSRVKIISLTNRPFDWIGKNWACFHGYKLSDGNILFFTDADTYHKPMTLELAINYFLSNQLDALTIMPKLLSNDIMTKITLPLFSIFMFTRFSPIRVNDPEKKVGYFFGSFYIISRKIYEKVGTHEGVKSEIIEDGALGRKVKEEKFKMFMLDGDDFVEAIWARSARGLWNGIHRLVIPLFNESKINAVLVTIAVFFLLLFPFLSLTMSVTYYKNYYPLTDILLILNIITSIIIMAITFFQNKYILFQKQIYGLCAPIGALVINAGFITGLFKSIRKGSVNWRDRVYMINMFKSNLRLSL